MNTEKLSKTPTAKEVIIALLAVGILAFVLLYFVFSVREWYRVCELCVNKSVDELPPELGKVRKRMSRTEFLEDLPVINNSFEPDIENPIGDEFMTYSKLNQMIVLEIIDDRVVRCHKVAT